MGSRKWAEIKKIISQPQTYSKLGAGNGRKPAVVVISLWSRCDERIWETVLAGRKHLHWRIDTVAV